MVELGLDLGLRLLREVLRFLHLGLHLLERVLQLLLPLLQPLHRLVFRLREVRLQGQRPMLQRVEHVIERGSQFLDSGHGVLLSV